ncbi:MAG: hypothetical protein JSR78_08445 [Proteobacteria bacterium]|nr:hypothetical protein [Pseudomonadota bacterium]
MPDKRDIKEIERDLSGAVMAFNVSRANLGATLRSLELRKASEDRLIGFAEEFGVDQLMRTLQETPELVDVDRRPTIAELAKVKPQLVAAHDAQARADKYLAEKEDILREKDPNHAKAILLGGRETVIDLKRGIARDVETGREEALVVERVKARDLANTDEYGQDDEDEMER